VYLSNQYVIHPSFFCSLISHSRSHVGQVHRYHYSLVLTVSLVPWIPCHDVSLATLLKNSYVTLPLLPLKLHFGPLIISTCSGTRFFYFHTSTALHSGSCQSMTIYHLQYLVRFMFSPMAELAVCAIEPSLAAVLLYSAEL